MKKLLIMLLSLIGISVLPSCSSDISEENKYGSIAGSVSDATTGEPVSTVRVKLTPGGNSTVTGTDGSFHFLNLEPAEYTLDFSKEGYKTNSAKVNVKIGSPTSAHLLIERIPSIVTADRETLDFGDNQSLNTLSFNIVNSSYEDLEWWIEERCEWITEINPSKDVLKYGHTQGIVVVIDRELLEAGENKAVIVINSSHGSSQMNVVAIGADKALPSLNTLDATDITSSSAILHGEISFAGTPEYTERGFVYSMSPEPTIENTISKLSCKVDAEKEFSYQLKGLDYGKIFYVRAYATSKLGTAYSTNEISFKTTVTLPSLKMLDATNVTPSSATLNGEITDAGTPSYTERGFVYSLNPTPTLDNSIAKISCKVNNDKKYIHNLSGLNYDKKYYVRGYAISDVGTVYSTNEINFTTTAIKPQVTTLDIDNADLSAGTATFRGKISNIGEPAYTERGFVYGTMPEPTIYDNKVIANGVGELGNFSKYVTDLPKTTYYVRAYATTPAGTTYGEEKTVSLEWVEIPSAGIAVQKEDLGKGDWATAVTMCENSTLGGLTDWRLPTIEELMVLYNNRDKIGGFDNSKVYWSSSPASYNGYLCINFENGLLGYSSYSSLFKIRAVRSLNKE